MLCEYCNKTFKTKSSLNHHKKTAKYCLEKQNNKDPNILSCKYCKQTFTVISSLNKHYDTCKAKEVYVNFEKEIDKLTKYNIILKKDREKNITLKDEITILENENTKLKEEIVRLKDENTRLSTENKIYLRDHEHIHELVNKPVINTNNNNKVNNNVLQVNCIIDDIDKIKAKIDTNLNINHISEGQKGIALFAVENLLKDENGKLTYYCSDTSRKYFKFKNSEGGLTKDIQAKKLTKQLCDAKIIQTATDIAQNWWTDENGTIITDRFDIMAPKAFEIKDLYTDNSNFYIELSNLTTE